MRIKGLPDPQRIDLTKKKFGKLIVKEFYETRDKRAYWSCACVCGNTKVVSGKELRSGHTKSCGCHARAWVHGLHKHKFYNTYQGMLKRCYNKKHIAYPRYGGRGISVCQTWREDINKFLKWCETKEPIPVGHTLDRRNNNGNYTPRNCRFVSKSQQQRNRRKRTS